MNLTSLLILLKITMNNLVINNILLVINWLANNDDDSFHRYLYEDGEIFHVIIKTANDETDNDE